jgi:ribose-phosphate pyrophosphokinase
MSNMILLPLAGNETFATSLVEPLDARLGQVEARHFPDGESYLRIVSELGGRDVAVVCTLARPDEKILPLLFAAATARELGARKVGLIAPYLAYMRQDRRFKPGEAISSRPFAAIVSAHFDWLVTVDPHLHRYGSLAEIYSIPTRVAHAASAISAWIKLNVESPVIVGPDRESEQWVAEVASEAGAPFIVLEKSRAGDRDVTVRTADLAQWPMRTPVLVDDIVSSGGTMIEAVRMLRSIGALPPVCVAVHGLFADQVDRKLERIGVRVVTTNAVPHWTNLIDVSELVAAATIQIRPTV